MLFNILTELAIGSAILYKFGFNNLLFNLMALDGIISAIHFIKTVVQQYNNSFEDIITTVNSNIIKTNNINYNQARQLLNKQNFLFKNNDRLENFNITFIEKYIYFFALQLISFLLGIIFWFHFYKIINCILLLFAVPSLAIIIYKNYYYVLFCIAVEHKIQEVSIYIMSKLTVKIMNMLSETCLNCKPNFDYREMLQIYESPADSMKKLGVFIKTFLSLMAVHYMKTTDNRVYKYLFNIVHQYQTDQLSLGNIISNDVQSIAQVKNNI